MAAAAALAILARISLEPRSSLVEFDRKRETAQKTKNKIDVVGVRGSL